MKYFVSILFSTLLFSNLFSQTTTTPIDTSNSGQVNVKEPDLESMSLSFTSTKWLNTENNVMSDLPSIGFDFYYFKDYKLSGNNITFAPGLGISVQNAGNNAMVVYHMNNAGTAFDSTTLVAYPDSMEYISNHLVQDWVDVPLEFRFRTNNNSHGKSFKVALGGKVGYMLGNHFTHSEKDVDDKISKYKMYHIRNLNPIRYGVSGRVGFGSVSLGAFYSLSSLFANESDDALQALSLSLTFSLNTNP